MMGARNADAGNPYERPQPGWRVMVMVARVRP